VYDKLRAAAQRAMAGERPGHALTATALVHEAYARLVGAGRDACFANRAHFYHAAALMDAAFAASAQPGDAEVLQTLGMALDRVGRWDEAVGVLSRADEPFVQSGQWGAGGGVGRPSCIAFLVVAQGRAGDVDAAEASLARLRRLAEAPRWRGKREVEVYVTEAMVVIGAGAAR